MSAALAAQILDTSYDEDVTRTMLAAERARIDGALALADFEYEQAAKAAKAKGQARREALLEWLAQNPGTRKVRAERLSVALNVSVTRCYQLMDAVGIPKDPRVRRSN